MVKQLSEVEASSSGKATAPVLDGRSAQSATADDELRREIRRRERAEKALRASQERHRLQIENLPVGVFRMEPDEKMSFMLANNAISQMLGYESVEELLKTKIAGAFEDIEEFDSLFENLMVQGRVASEEVRLKKLDGTPLWGEITAILIRNESGQADYVNGLIVDVTERKLLETQLAQAQKLEAMGQLAAGIAHEINTPIQYVGDNTRFVQESTGFLTDLLQKYDRLLREANVGAELLAKFKAMTKEADLEYLLEEIPLAIRQSLEGVDRVVAIVRAMKEFAHPDTDEKAPTDVNKLIESTVTLARNEWKYVADMEMDFDPDLPPVPVLVGDLKQVVLNILVNAAHAIEDVAADLPSGKGVITVATSSAGRWAEIRISDTGSGIPESARPKIFDLFFTTKPPGKGTGQGLAISRAVVEEKHGGTITFETETGKGTTFIIRIPIIAPDESRERGAL